MRNDGKYLEDELETQLKKITRTDFHWRRLHDAKAARTYMPAQPADFFIADKGKAFHVECKSVGKKTRRFPKFTQLPDMLRWQKAGVPGYVLIHFHELDEFYFVPVTQLEFGKPSWVICGEFKVESVESVVGGWM